MTESQIPKLLAVLVEHWKQFGGLSKEEVQSVIYDPKGAIKLFTDVIKKEYIKKNILMVESTHTVFVPGCSFTSAIEIGDFGYVGLNEKDFPLDNSTCVGNKEMALFNFDKFKKNISLKDAIKKMESAGYRPATLREFLAFLKDYVNHDDKIIIVALGSSTIDGDRVPVFSNGDRRDLDTVFSANLYLHDCYFLAVLKNGSSF